MSDGIIPSVEFNEQLKRFVRENMRRERGTQRQGRWHKKGAGGGGGDCCCGCLCIAPNMVHPGGFETVREWTVTLKNAIPWTLNDNSTGEVQLEAGSYTFTWDDTAAKWLCDVSSGVSYRDLNGDPQTATKTGDSTIEWISGGDYVVSFVYNAVE